MRGHAAQRPTAGAGTSGAQVLPWRSVALVLAVVAVFAAIHQVILNRAHPDALYMDSLRLLFQLDQWQAGQLSTFEFWGGSSHRGFVNQLFLWANVSLFDLDVLLANRLTGAVISTVAVCLCIAWLADMRRQPGAQRPWLNVVVMVTLAALCFSWAGYELLTLDLGLPLWTKNLAFVAFFCGHAHLLSGRSRRPALWVVALVLAAPLIVLVCGMGWNYAFVGAVVIVQVFSFLPRWRAEGRWTGILPSAAVALSMVVYLLSGSVTDASTRNGLNIGLDLPALLLYAVGSTMGYPEAVLMGGRLPLEAIAVVGGILLLVGVVAAVAWLRRGAPGSRLPLLLALYGVLIAASLTLARGAEGPFAVMASRYYMDLVLGLAGVIWLAARELQAAPRASGWNALVGGLLSAVMLTQLLTYVHEWRASPFREAIFASMNKALLRAVPDEAAAGLLQAQLDYARKGANVMRERRLALYADSTASDCSTRRIGYTQGWHPPEGAVRWSGAHASLALPPCGCAYFAELYVPPGQSERHVRINTGGGNEDVLTVRPGQAARARVGNEHAELTVSPVSIPSRDQPGSSDARELGVLLTGFSVSCEVP
ncbi:hypothetical protein D7T58_04455 [Stenotrophomonas maltophilia]|uniref:hypothetical protein n=1 Tax=Stenotrophomonas TaxID=40323 RepID=UPI0003A82127|nr:MULTISPECIES: hypothetical protein [Stenotrophomonas]MBA0264436.1 hypothetical protein [Stenotrophomonas maltophilia]MBA0467961.1 hypothetical protein [Stenotrophomonas maltophilia]MBA0477105.1 hypothetical protein [Stenotrophomonas maltophilia]MCR1004304.1 hypothetical protein [Stenotrophomonas maltophilia]MCR1571671.1 hypothetical protein [Stenotrophomonas sp.]